MNKSIRVPVSELYILLEPRYYSGSILSLRLQIDLDTGEPLLREQTTFSCPLHQGFSTSCESCVQCLFHSTKDKPVHSSLVFFLELIQLQSQHRKVWERNTCYKDLPHLSIQMTYSYLVQAPGIGEVNDQEGRSLRAHGGSAPEAALDAPSSLDLERKARLFLIMELGGVKWKTSCGIPVLRTFPPGTHSLTHPPTRPPTRPLNHSLAHSHTHTNTHTHKHTHTQEEEEDDDQ
jgi:hypothetical protein